MDSFLGSVGRPDFWREIAPGLHVEGHPSPAPPAPPAAPPSAFPGGRGPPTAPWPREGYLRLDGLLAPSLSARLAEAVASLRARGAPATFLYVYDETWAVLDALLGRIAPLLGPEVEPLADIWAWHIDPRVDRGGWPLHRGWYEDVRGADGAPGLVNAWIALTEATERNACMHVVPLPRDVHYPRALREVGGLEALGVALPAAAGSALAWDANVAHWGGRCDPSFTQPRISMSFTLRRRGYAIGIPALRLPLSFGERLDLIANQLETYGPKELALDSPAMQWARMVHGMVRVRRGT